MKIATVTWITYNNYGTELQAYALQQYFKGMGIQNDIISDRDIVLKNKNVQKDGLRETRISPSDDEKFLIKQFRRVNKYVLHPVKFGKTLLRYCIDKRRTERLCSYTHSQKAFEAFKEEQLQIINGLRREDMSSLNQQYDAFVCGSDQIWSVFDRNFDGYFYMDFVDKKKIAYAVSVGTDQINHAHGAQIAKWLKDYSAISVREEKTAEQLSALTGKEVVWTADPTLLFDRTFWSDFCVGASFPKEKYLLCYFLTDNPWYFDYASALAKYLHLKVLLIPSSAIYTERKVCYRKAVGPIEFVSLFQHAEYVLTDSYHGSIFSMLFEKGFIYLKRFEDTDPICQNIRITSLFQKVGLMNHIIEKKVFIPSDIQQIDYEMVNEILIDFRRQSRQFLRNALSKV